MRCIVSVSDKLSSCIFRVELSRGGKFSGYVRRQVTVSTHCRRQVATWKQSVCWTKAIFNCDVTQPSSGIYQQRSRSHYMPESDRWSGECSCLTTRNQTGLRKLFLNDNETEVGEYE